MDRLAINDNIEPDHWLRLNGDTILEWPGESDFHAVSRGKRLAINNQSIDIPVAERRV